LKEEAESFASKLNKYLGPHQYTKKMDQKQKWQRKVDLDFEFKPNRILTKLQRVDDIMRKNLLSILFEKNKNKNRY
jgi:hypothetical protein